jgi:hypothetical protein
MWTIAASVHRAVEHATCHGEFAKRKDCVRIHGSRVQLAAELLTLAQYESGLCESIHADQCERYQCDPARVVVNGEASVVHLARGLWQGHRLKSWTDATWNGMSGASEVATGNAAWQAAKLLSAHERTCGSVEGAFAGYATGGHCYHKQAHVRAVATEHVARKILQFAKEDTR